MRGKRNLKGQPVKTVRVPISTIAAVDEIAAMEGRSREDMASALIQEGIAAREIETFLQLERGTNENQG